MNEKVTVVDIDIPFGRMVIFIVKWTLASIPAMILLSIIFGVLAALLGACGLLPFLANSF